MIEKVNPSHPDKLADRIAGAIVDLAYTKDNNPKIAVEIWRSVLYEFFIIANSSYVVCGSLIFVIVFVIYNYSPISTWYLARSSVIWTSFSNFPFLVEFCFTRVALLLQVNNGS